MTGTEAASEASVLPRMVQMRSAIMPYPLIIRMHVWRVRMSGLIPEVMLWRTSALLHRTCRMFLIM